jgi:hypothetical protein
VVGLPTLVVMGGAVTPAGLTQQLLSVVCSKTNPATHACCQAGLTHQWLVAQACQSHFLTATPGVSLLMHSQSRSVAGHTCKQLL